MVRVIRYGYPVLAAPYLWMIVMHRLGLYYALDFLCLTFLVAALHLTAARYLDSDGIAENLISLPPTKPMLWTLLGATACAALMFALRLSAIDAVRTVALLANAYNLRLSHLCKTKR